MLPPRLKGGGLPGACEPASRPGLRPSELHPTCRSQGHKLPARPAGAAEKKEGGGGGAGKGTLSTELRGTGNPDRKKVTPSASLPSARNRAFSPPGSSAPSRGRVGSPRKSQLLSHHVRGGADVTWCSYHAILSVLVCCLDMTEVTEPSARS